MKQVLSFTMAIFLLFISSTPAFAIVNPLSQPNNKVGIHILFPTELQQAAGLVNSSGGDWGYVTIPIQSGDKDLVKWQNFMDTCAKLHLIPIIRLATEGDYFNTQVWRVPTDADVEDFANFLNSLNWPTKNRYIIVYNEVNRGDEWGGLPDPAAYANLLSYAVDVFKSRSADFFIISAGMDNAAADTGTSMDEYTYYQDMQATVPGIFNKIDGIDSHSYPNPAFSSSPETVTRESVDSFFFEKNIIESYSTKDLPVFITETGWDQNVVGQQTAATNLTDAFQNVWNNSDIVAVTPFLLQAGAGPFQQFSLYNADGSENIVYKALAALSKTKGQPIINVPEAVLAAKTKVLAGLPTEHFSNVPSKPNSLYFLPNVKLVLKWFLGMN